eukprot:6210561-Pleurochrysis_carterae.AAC.1
MHAAAESGRARVRDRSHVQARVGPETARRTRLRTCDAHRPRLHWYEGCDSGNTTARQTPLNSHDGAPEREVGSACRGCGPLDRFCAP